MSISYTSRAIQFVAKSSLLQDAVVPRLSCGMSLCGSAAHRPRQCRILKCARHFGSQRPVIAGPIFTSYLHLDLSNSLSLSFTPTPHCPLSQRTRVAHAVAMPVAATRRCRTGGWSSCALPATTTTLGWSSLSPFLSNP